MKRTTAILSACALLAGSFLIYDSYSNGNEQAEFDMEQLAAADQNREAVITTASINNSIDTYSSNCIPKKAPPHTRDTDIKVCQGEIQSSTEIVKVGGENIGYTIQLGNVGSSYIYQLKNLVGVDNGNLGLMKFVGDENTLEINRSKEGSSYLGKVMIKKVSGEFIQTIYTQDLTFSADSTIVIDSNDGELTISTEGETLYTDTASFEMSDTTVILYNIGAGVVYNS